MTAFLLLGLVGLGLLAFDISSGNDDDHADDPAPDPDFGPDPDPAGPDDPDSIAGMALNGTAGNDFLRGGAGDDTLDGQAGHDLLVGGPGDDLLLGDRGDDLLLGGAGDDTLQGGRGDDLLIAGAGNDLLQGDDGDDLLLSLSGHDTLDGGAGDDVLMALDLPGGSALADLVAGAIQDGLGDGLFDDLQSAMTARFGSAAAGQAGNVLAEVLSVDDDIGPDVLRGGAGDDLLIGDSGDTMSGGSGDDTFVVAPLWHDMAHDPLLITDYAVGEQVILSWDDVTPQGPAVAPILTQMQAGADVELRLDGRVAVLVQNATAGTVNASVMSLTAAVAEGLG